MQSIFKLRGKYDSTDVDEKVSNVFHSLDKDGDAKLTEQEFVLGVQTTPGLTELLLEDAGAYIMGSNWVVDQKNPSGPLTPDPAHAASSRGHHVQYSISKDASWARSVRELLVLSCQGCRSGGCECF